MDESRPKRKHVRTGNPVGGHRPGAGRPPGPSALGHGEVRAVKACKLRLPPNATPGQEAAAERAFERLVDIMEEKVHYLNANSVLKAATRLREEACGPLTQKVEHTGRDGEQLQVVVQAYGQGDDDADGEG